ncbi:MAG TPA: heavy-metal-associated domain-containing protein [Mycobacteriales bacterium]|jgi:copper chaperone CopZ|nr:heavy-metal-associated domain-containing protein [Mycobacteriales bacterium]
MTTTASYSVTGMTCGHCVAAVTEELTALPGVENVHVQLVPGAVSVVTVTSGAPLTDDVVREAVDEAGYEVTGRP